jgi:predicted nucleic acid-binding protein
VSAFLDTNVLVYAYDPADPAKQQRALELMSSLGHEEIVISAQVLSEFFVAVQRLDDPLPPPEADAAARLLTHLRVISVDSSLVQRALDIRERWQTSYWDGLILAAAERAGADTVYTEDLSHGQFYGDVRVQNPFA